MACGKADKNASSQIRIKMPEQLPSQKLRSSFGILNRKKAGDTKSLKRLNQAPGDVGILSDIWAPSFAPKNTSELNCFGVLIGGPEEDGLATNFCEKTEDGEVINFGVQALGIKPGEEISLSVDAGENREIRILGWQAENEAACESLIEGTEVEGRQLSHPFIIATDIRELTPGDQTININASFTNSEELVNCDVFQEKIGSLSTRVFTIGGTVSGNKEEDVPGDNLQLSLNGGTPEEIIGNGFGTFENLIGDLVEYEVTVAQQPAGKSCEVINGTGVVNGADVTDLEIPCEDVFFNVSGDVSGFEDHGEGGLEIGKVSSASFEEENSGQYGKSTVTTNTEFITVNQNGPFSFQDDHLHNEVVRLFIASHPVGQTCSLAVGPRDDAETGFVDVTINNADIGNVEVTCETNTFTVSGTLSGLIEGRSITIENQAYTEQQGEGEIITLTENDTFTFEQRLPFNDNYTVSIVSQPIGETCTVENGTGVVTEDVTNVNIVCVPDKFTIGGNISGLLANRTLFMNLNTNTFSQNKGFTANGSYTFESKVASGQSFTSRITSQPVGQTCAINGGSQVSGTPIDSDILDFSVVCITNSFTVGGSVQGLINGRSVTIGLNNGNSLTLESNGTFTFQDPIDSGQTYTVSVTNQPVGQTCSVQNGSGEIEGSNITDVVVDCVADSFTIGGNLSGLIIDQNNRSVTLELNETESLAVDQNGAFQFNNQVDSGQTYTVRISQQPIGQTCALQNESGVVLGSNINDVVVTCAPDSFTVGGTVTGHPGNETDFLTIQNNGGDNLDIFFNGEFTFETPVESGQSFDITITAQPTNFTCTVSGGSGAVVDQNITSPVITCVENTFTIQASISGVTTGEDITVTLNETESVVVNGNGNVQQLLFNTLLTNGASYDVTVTAEPPGQICTVTNGSGTIEGANVDDVSVSCADNPIASGTFDTNFGSGGQVEIDTTSDDLLQQIELDSNNRLNFTFQSFGARISACRFDLDGNFDPNWNGGFCQQFISIGGFQGLTPNAMKVDSSDQMIIAGTTAGNMFVAKILADGSAEDTSFDLDGIRAVGGICTAGTPNSNEATALAINPDNDHIFAAGNATQTGETEGLAWLALNGNGSINSSFANDAQFSGAACIDDNTSSVENVQATTLDNQGKLLTTSRFNEDLRITRLIADDAAGSSAVLDSSFGGDGHVDLNIAASVDPGNPGTSIAHDIIVDSFDRIYIAGTALGSQDGFIARLLSDGSLDESFGVGGIVVFNQGGVEEFQKILIDVAGNILAAGFNTSTNTGVVVRYDSSGALDTSFASGGVLSRLNVLYEDMVIDSAGNIYVAGRHDNGSGSVTAIILKIN